MTAVKFKNDTYILPGSWDEIATKDLLTLSRLVISTKEKYPILFKLALSIMNMRMAMSYSVHLKGEPHYFIRRGIKKLYLVSASQMAVVTRCLEFIFDENSIMPRLKKNPFPILKISLLSRLYGPADGLTNMSLSEFMSAEIERDAFLRTQSDNNLNRFLAILWRPKIFRHADGDPRAPLNQDSIEYRAQRISKLKPHIKQVMIWFYLGVLYFLENKFDKVFSSNGESVQISAFDSFMNLVNQLARNDLSKFDKIRQSPLYDALYTFQNLLETDSQLKHKLKKK